MSRIQITGGSVYDPVHGLDGQIRDIWIEDGRVIPSPALPTLQADRVIDARGSIVMPGAIDMHSHLVGPKVNAGRFLRPETVEAWRDDRLARSALPLGSVALANVPTTYLTSYLYTAMGYTTAVDAAIPLMGARQAHFEFQRMPIIDRAMLTLAGNDRGILERLAQGDQDGVRDRLSWILRASGGYGIKVVNPGGVERHKRGSGEPEHLDDPIAHGEPTPRQILISLAQALVELGLPHPLHIHTIRLGRAGNAQDLLETMRTLDGCRAHLAHVQFHSYGQHGKQERITSRVPELAERFSAQPELTLDVGQILFGSTTTMTADAGLGAMLHRLTGAKWIGHDSELSSGCAVLPITYEARNLGHAIQWAIGLEWYLLITDPWRVALSTDHPNGSTFLNYPQAIALLMDRSLRQAMLDELPKPVRERTVLADLDREYSLGEIAIITRAAPARILGLADQGHLGPGADGNVTIYSCNDDREAMFANPRWVLKRGEVVLADSEFLTLPPGRTLVVRPHLDRDAEVAIDRWYADYASVSPSMIHVNDHEIGRNQVSSPPTSKVVS